MATIEEPVAIDGDEARAVRLPRRRRGRRDPQRRARRDGRQARPVPRAGGRRPADAGRARTAHRRSRALRARVAERAGGGRLRRVRPGRRHLHAAARADRRADGRRAAPRTCRASSRSRSAAVIDSPRITETARSGEGFGWHEHNHDVFEGCERFFRPGYNANLIAAWLPALDGVVDEARGRREGRRHRLRPRVVDDPDGAGVPELDVRRLRLPRGLDRDRARARRRRPASPTACASRSRRAADAPGRRLRPRHDVRLPARHGRPGRRRAPRARGCSPTTARG